MVTGVQSVGCVSQAQESSVGRTYYGLEQEVCDKVAVALWAKESDARIRLQVQQQCVARIVALRSVSRRLVKQRAACKAAWEGRDWYKHADNAGRMLGLIQERDEHVRSLRNRLLPVERVYADCPF